MLTIKNYFTHMKKYLVIIILFCSLQSMAQNSKIEISPKDYDNTSVEMADNMRQEGKIYVVVLVLCIIMGGILFYTIRTDKKVSKLEKEMK